MKIIQVIPSLGPGGAERFVVDLSNELVKKGHEVILICLYKIDLYPQIDFYDDELSNKIKLIRLEKKVGLDLKLFIQLSSLIKDLNPDVVHTHLRAFLYLVPCMLRNRKIKYIHTIHNDAWKESGGRINSLLKKYMFKNRYCYPVTISETSDNSFEDLYKTGIKRTMIPNGTTPYLSNSNNVCEIEKYKHLGKSVFVNVARLMPQKNQLSLTEAFRSLSNSELLLLGNENTDYAKLVKDNLPLNCHILGVRKNPRDYMAQADAFILSSEFEGMPISLIECFSVGTIPICTPVGGIVNMIEDGVNGILAKSSSSIHIREAIQRFLNLSTDKIKLMKIAALDSFKKYDMNNCADNYLRIYETI